ncbi:hypothetical protein SFRURICE_017965 [Spodoptera frugiperda]|nr:hypothetical protein SFRURICE_017965 [Spodoptera frugiperda]
MNSVNMFEMYDVADFTSTNQGTQDHSDNENEELLAAYDQYLNRCVDIEDYEHIRTINEGTYGVVYKATHKQTGELVAVKYLKCFDSEERFSIAAARELKFLMNLWHENIVLVHELAMGASRSEMYIVMEYLPHQIRSLLDTVRNKRQRFGPEHIHCLMTQLIRALAYLHQNRVMHRDLKPENILMCKDGYLKVADFGMAREFKLSPRQYTPGMCSLWYRAPELLLLSKEYSTSVDMWSIGCIFAEFINIWPLFLGESETDQLKKIYKVLGTPSDTVWPGYSTLPLVGDITFDEYEPSGLRKEIKHEILSDSGLDLLQRMLIYDPKRRISAKEALRHKYFDNEPVTISPDEFLKSLDLEDDHEDTDSDTGADEQSDSDMEDEEKSGSSEEDLTF